MLIDLHTHSDASDGTYAPAQLMQQAADRGLDVIGLTDHDTTAGWESAAHSARSCGVNLARGVEFSTGYFGRTLHLLGYLFEPCDEIENTIRRVRESRRDRAKSIVDYIGQSYDITWDDVCALAGQDTIGRPHIADALVAKGYFVDREAAFDDVVGPAGARGFSYYTPDIEDTISMIRRAGGVPILAHPGTTKRRFKPLQEPDLVYLVQCGLLGLEVDHPEHSPHTSDTLRRFVLDHDLIATGSSDYHGKGKKTQLGDHTTSITHWQRIVERGTLDIV